MVSKSGQDTAKQQAPQASAQPRPEPNKIGSSTPYDFDSKNLTAYGGLLPVATMLEKLQFEQLVKEKVKVKRATRVLAGHQFLLSLILAVYVGFSRLNHMRFLRLEPMLLGILKVLRLPPQCTYWRFLASLPVDTARQLLEVQAEMRERVWVAANLQLQTVTLDTDTTVHTLFGRQMGARKGYNPKNKGKKSYQPILTFIAETREYLMGKLHNGDRHTGAQIARHLELAIAAVPKRVLQILARADAGFYCWEAVQTYEKYKAQFILVARKTARLIEQLQTAPWKPSPKTDAAEQCEFMYQPQGWGQAYRFLALRYEKKKAPTEEPTEQYQLFETSDYIYRVFVTNMTGSIADLVWFYRQRGAAENLIKEANNDAGLAAYPSRRWDMNHNHFQISMLAYNLNCWLMLFNREESENADNFRHVKLSTSRLRFLFLAAKIWRHAGRVGVSYSDHYEEKGIFQRLMNRLQAIARNAEGFIPVIAVPFRY